MNVRPGRGQSLIGGVMALVVMFAGLMMMSSGPSGGAGISVVVWLLFGLVIAGVSVYNAFSDEGLPTYEIDMKDTGDSFCRRCGRPASSDDRFCRSCGAALR